ncbi:ATP-binding protein [Sphingosinicella sp.]|uniref:ATP-binding protein n=1 Tax=Sphingosinicella sp. TaxID=1917971 RepID=UPI0040378DD7
MTSDLLTRVLLAALIAAAGGGLAWWLGAPPIAILAALAAGLVAHAVARPPRGVPAPAAPPVEATETATPSLDEVIEAIDEPLLIVRERRVLRANAAAKTLLGAHIDGVDVRLAIRHPAAAERLAGEPAESDAGDVEIVGLGEAGRPWLMRLRALPDGSQLVRLIDQSATRAAEQMRVDFVANASHELRTPLATLLGFLETLEDEEAASDPATRARFLRIMSGEASRMRALVDDLMSLSRIEAERFAAPRGPVDLLDVIEEVRDALAQPLAAQGATLAIENEAPSAVVQGDEPQLAQMLANLIANALKYGREGRPVRVRLAHEDGDMLSIAVIDEGEGIAPEHLPRLTERFYRVDASRSRQVGGTGLGLAIVKHIVQRHRGRLEIASKVGEGTVARALLPLATVTEESRN